MKTSNKILLGTFLLVLVIITAIHAAIYAKYKRNDFITMQVLHDERYASYTLSNVQALSLISLGNVKIVPSDTAKLEIEKDGGKELRHDIVNGVLTIKGDSVVDHWSNSFDRVRNSREVIIYLPRIQHIQAEFSELDIQGVKDSLKALSFSLDIANTDVHFSGNYEENKHSVNSFDQITVTKASHSTVNFSDNTFVKALNLALDSTEFEDGGADFNSISINSDSKSSVKLSGKNIKKTKFILQ